MSNSATPRLIAGLALGLSLASSMAACSPSAPITPSPLPSTSPSATPSGTPSANPSGTPAGTFRQSAGCAAAPGGNLVSNPSFEEPNAGDKWKSFTSAFAGWDVAGPIDVVGTYWQAGQGNQSAELSGGAVGSITQTVATRAGQGYRLSFCMSANPEGGNAAKRMDVLWNDKNLGTLSFETAGKSKENMGWVSYSIDLAPGQVSAGSKLSFKSLEAGYFGPAVDNVSVTQQ